MTSTDREQAIVSAKSAFTAAGVLLAGSFRIEVAAADPEHERLIESLAELMPACRELVTSFPAVRGRVAGLLYESVKYRGYKGSSALHVVAQIADQLLEAGRSLPATGQLSPEHLSRLAEELERALPTSIDDWLRNRLDVELAALERKLGVTISDAFHQMGRPKHLGRIELMLGSLLGPSGEVQLARTELVSRGAEPEEVEVEFPTEKLAVVTRGRTRAKIKGISRVWVFRKVHEAAGRTVTWKELLQAELARAAPLLETGPTSPRMATVPATMQRTGNRIQEALGRLSYLWQQDGSGARWSGNED